VHFDPFEKGPKRGFLCHDGARAEQRLEGFDVCLHCGGIPQFHLGILPTLDKI
jgi:hypothetical protein